MLFSVLANDEQGQQNISSGHKLAAQHDPGGQQSSPNQSDAIIMVCLIEIEHLLNGMTPIVIMLH